MQNNINGTSRAQNIPLSDEITPSATNDQTDKKPRLTSRSQTDTTTDTQGRRFRNGVELFYGRESDSESDSESDNEDSSKDGSDNQSVRELRNSPTSASAGTKTPKQPRQDKTAYVRARASSKARAATESVASQYKRLQSAITSGDIQTVKELIDQHPELAGIADQDGVPLVFHAVSCGQADIAEILVRPGTFMAYQDSSGSTALHLAIAGGHQSLAEALILAGAPVNQTNNQGQTPLLLAASKGYTKLAKLLIQNTANIDQPDNGGYTPLMSAITKGQTELAKLLISKNAAIDRATSNGNTPLTLACKCDQPEILEMLIDKLPSPAAIDALSPAGIPLIMYAAGSGHGHIVKILLDHGATIDRTCDNGETALMSAAYYGHPPVVELLLDRGAALDQVKNNGYTAFTLACLAGNSDVVELLLDRGAVPDRVNGDGWTALMLACKAGHTPIAKLLLDRGAVPDRVNSDGWTALMLACNAGNTDVVELLLARGAALDPTTQEGWTALMLACQHGKVEVVELLFHKSSFSEKYPQQLATMLKVAALNDKAKVLEFLLTNLNNYLIWVKTLLYSDEVNLAHLALEQGHHEALATLIKHGIHPDDSSNTVWESTMKAADNGNLELLRLMIRELRSSLPISPSSWLSRDVSPRYLRLQQSLINAVRRGHHGIARLLIKAGGKPDYPTEDGNSALKEAIRQGNVTMLILMLDQNIELSRQDPNDKLSNELLLAISSDTPDPMLVDTLINFENEKTLGKGSFSFAFDFDKLFEGLQKLLLESYGGTKKSKFPNTAITTMLCTEFNLSYIVADRLTACLKTIVDAHFSSNKTDELPNENQLRMAFADSVICEQLFNDLMRGEDGLVEKCYGSHAQAPALARKLFDSAALHAHFLIALASAEAREYGTTLRAYLNALTSTTPPEQLQEFMQEAGWHPVVTQLVVESWAGLNESRTKDALFEAINARLSTTEFAEQFDQLPSDTARLLLHLQMIRLGEVLKG